MSISPVIVRQMCHNLHPQVLRMTTLVLLANPSPVPIADGHLRLTTVEVAAREERLIPVSVDQTY